MKGIPQRGRVLVGLLALAIAPNVRATVPNTVPNTADHCIRRFLAQDDAQPRYRAIRRLEAENGSRRGWLEAATEYTPATGFRYQVIAEGGSGYIREKILRGVLDVEQKAIAQGDTGRSSIAPENYVFEPSGVDPDGLARVLLSPRRKDRVLVAGAMFLQPGDGALVRLQGRLAKSPSFWVKNVDIVRSYQRIEGADLPVVLESKADVRLFGPATLRMTYVYLEVGGHPVRPYTSSDTASTSR
jgi:hypothetical protein